MNDHLEYYETVDLMAKHNIKICLETEREQKRREEENNNKPQTYKNNE
jgi:hypothetical protein